MWTISDYELNLAMAHTKYIMDWFPSVGMNTGYLTHFPVAQWSKRVRRRQRSQIACRETEWEIKNFHKVLERGGGRGRGSNKTSYYVLPWTIRITSDPLFIEKIAEDALKTTD